MEEINCCGLERDSMGGVLVLVLRVLLSNDKVVGLKSLPGNMQFVNLVKNCISCYPHRYGRPKPGMTPKVKNCQESKLQSIDSPA